MDGKHIVLFLLHDLQSLIHVSGYTILMFMKLCGLQLSFKWKKILRHETKPLDSEIQLKLIFNYWYVVILEVDGRSFLYLCNDD